MDVDLSPFPKPSECKGRTYGAYTTWEYTKAKMLAPGKKATPEQVKATTKVAYSKAKALYEKHGGK